MNANQQLSSVISELNLQMVEFFISSNKNLIFKSFFNWDLHEQSTARHEVVKKEENKKDEDLEKLIRKSQTT